MAYQYSKSIYDQFEELSYKFDNQGKLLKDTNVIITELKNKIKSLNDVIIDLKKTNEEQAKEILRLKNINNKDSSNSSKPSGTNGFKKVITNRREKSSKGKGGQSGHPGHTIDNKVDKFINSGNVEETIVEVNKNEKNKNKRYIEKTIIDLVITKHIIKYRYYPHEDGKYYIPKCHNQKVKYGSTIKAICIDLMNNLYNSTDGIVRFIGDITNEGITLSKGTLINWNNELALNLSKEINTIENNLLDSYYLNHDESQIKIDGDGYNILCACNDKNVRLWTSEHKSQESLDKIGFLPKFKGVIVKDGTELYNKYGCFLSQCISHIQRYLKGIYDNINHKGPKKLSDFFTKYNNLRNNLIEKEIKKFDSSQYQSIIDEYNKIISEWEIELRNDTNNYIFNEENKLFTRLKYDNKKMDETIRGDRDEILYFLRDFKVPSTNNNAESSQRGVKIKQKIGKFRSVDGAEAYSIIKSCMLTYKKRNINIYKALIDAFDNKSILA